MIKGIWWDFSGVLFLPQKEHPHEEFSALLGIQTQEFEAFFSSEYNTKVDLGEISDEEFMEIMRKKFDLKQNLLGEYRRRFMEAYAVNAELCDFIEKNKPSFSMVLLSNYSAELRYFLEEDLEIAGIFDEIIISAEVGMIKPNREIYEYTLQKVKLQAHEVIFVDDRQENIEGAQACGMHAVLFQDSDQTLREIKTLIAGNEN